MKTAWKIALSLLILQPFTAPAQAPITVRGTVGDTTGAVVGKAEVFAESSVWSGRRDVLSPPYTTVSDDSGNFTLTLPAGDYFLVVLFPGFRPKAGIIHVDEKTTELPELVLIPAHSQFYPRDEAKAVFAQKLRGLAGSGARECGQIKLVEQDGPRLGAVNRCVLTAARRHAPFWVFYLHSGVDSDVFSGLAGDASGKVYHLKYDSANLWTTETLNAEEMRKVIRVEVCENPIHWSTRESDGSLLCAPAEGGGGK